MANLHLEKVLDDFALDDGSPYFFHPQRHDVFVLDRWLFKKITVSSVEHDHPRQVLDWMLENQGDMQKKSIIYLLIFKVLSIYQLNKVTV